MAERTGRIVVVSVGQPGGIGTSYRSAEPDDVLRIRVTVRRSETPARDRAEVEVWGPGLGLLGELAQPGAVCQVAAGYQSEGDDPPLLISGSVVPGSVRTPRRGGSRVASWLVQEGGLSLAGAPVSRVWSGQVLASQVLREVASLAHLPIGSEVLGEDVTYRRGYAAVGSVGDVLADLARDTGSVIGVRDGVIRAYPAGGSERPGAWVIGPDSGMVGDPEPIEGGVEVISLLLPGMRPGDRYLIDGTERDGEYVAQDVTHDLVTDGTRYYSIVRGVPLSGARVPSPSAVAAPVPQGRTARPTMADAVRETATRAAARVRVCGVGRIVSYDAAAQTVEMLPLVPETTQLPDGSLAPLRIEPVAGVPVLWPQGAGYSVTHPLGAGDLVILHHRDRSHDEVDAGRGAGQEQPRSTRRWSWADVVAVPAYSTPGSLGADARRGDGRVVAMPAGAATHYGSASAASKLVTWEVLEAFWGAVRKFFAAHGHICAAPGVTSGPPTVALPDIPEAMATGRLRVDDAGAYAPPDPPDPPPEPPPPE